MQIEFDGTQYASTEEVMFSSYVAELLERGWLVDAIYQPRPFLLAPDTHVYAREHTKKGTKESKVKLLNKHIFTADWELTWSEKADGVFTWNTQGTYKHGFYPYRKGYADNFIPFYEVGGVSYIDVKGEVVGRNNSSAITFPLNQKWVMASGYYVQKVIVSLKDKSVFARTFTPRRVVVDEVYKKDYKRNGKILAREGDSKIKYEIVLIEHFEKKKEL